MIHVPSDTSFSTAIDTLRNVTALLHDHLGDGAVLQFARFMVSDATVGSAVIDSGVCAEAARTVVIQPPLDGSMMSVWLVWLTDVDSAIIGENLLLTSWNGLKILWQGDTSAMLPSDGPGTLTETRSSLLSLSSILENIGTTLPRACHRTWFMVRDIDHNYRGVVEGRNEVFEQLGLTRHTHFIASTGIGGSPVSPDCTIVFNSYSVIGLDESCVRYLKAEGMMNNTMDYGVAFERGTLLRFPDRRQVLVSGTASIDHLGRILHEGDVVAQAGRMIRNVDTLIDEAGASRADICYAIVYLRNPGDFAAVEPLIRREFPRVPLTFVHAPVCREGWLVEMECSLLASDSTSLSH